MLRGIFSKILVVSLIWIGLNFLTFLYWGEIYQSQARLIINQEFNISLDPYAMAQENNYLAGVFSQVTKSFYFYEKIREERREIDRTYFEKKAGGEKEKILKKWNETVKVSPQVDSGIIKITVHHSNKEQARLIVEAIRDYLINHHREFHLRGENVKLKVVDPLFTERIFPNWLVLILGLVMLNGLVLLIDFDKKTTKGQFKR